MLLSTFTPTALALFTTDPATLTMMWQTVVLGMAMIFAVLAILWAILAIFKLIFVGPTPKAQKPEKKEEPKPEPKAAAPAAPVAAPVAEANDAELVAIITAAVAAYMAEEGTEYTGGFRVVSFKRVRGGRTWNAK
ncbi:MAG: hypothetical protein E7653_08505 [Ruminococcaceae bacterium]|nr:hypothetical protein [Oscillospiraceae bacterium]